MKDLIKSFIQALLLTVGIYLIASGVVYGGFWYGFGGGFLIGGSVIWFRERK